MLLVPLFLSNLNCWYRRSNCSDSFVVRSFLFTIYFKFSNITLLGVAIRATNGKYDEVDHNSKDDISEEDVAGSNGDEVIEIKGVVGEVTHFQALTAALSATVGLGNIAGVAVAVQWWSRSYGLDDFSWVFRDVYKISGSDLGRKYREVGEDGKIYGGPMYYLKKGLKEKNLGILGKILAGLYAVFVIGGSFGGGNMFQANQAAAQFKQLFDIESGFVFGIVMALLVGIVIIGGIKRIGRVTEKVVPFMAIVFVGASLIILAMNFAIIPEAMGQIWDGAFRETSVAGGLIGVMIVGFQRAAFSNEAGVGSASIAHAAVKTKFPASEGIVASIGPFVDTVIVCSMTALVIVVTNLRSNLFTYGNLDAKSNVLLNATNEPINGVDLTSVAFDSAIPNFSIILTIAVILFAFSSMLSWSYYGIQGWTYLFGKGKVADITYKILFLLFVVIGASSTLGSVIEFSDAMIFAMVFPNIIGLLLLAPKVKVELARYLKAIDYKNKK